MKFDKIIDRRNTDCVKYDGMEPLFGRKDLIPLWIADMDFEICPAIADAIRRRAEHRVYGYHEPPQSYWQAIIDWNCRRHHFCIEKEEICYMRGVVRGLGFIINYFTSKGDKILIQPPVYHPFKRLIEGNGRVAVFNRLKSHEGKPAMDLAMLEKQIAEECPKLMVLCNPHNPGGIVWDRQTLAEVARICRKNGVVVVSDEIHGDVELFGNKYTPFATVSEDAAMISIVMGAPSKTFNIPGLASSWCVIKNPELRHGFFEWMEVNEFSSPTQFVTLATEAAYKEGEPWLNEMLAYIEGNVLFTEDFLRKRVPEIKMLRPQASYLIWLDCTGLGLKGEELVRLFTDKAGVALNNGEMFGIGGECHMRMNVGCPRATLEVALERIEKAVAESCRH